MARQRRKISASWKINLDRATYALAQRLKREQGRSMVELARRAFAVYARQATP